MTEKIVLIGAGSAMFTRGIVGDFIKQGDEMELVLVDINPEALSVAEGLAKKMIEQKKAPIHLVSSVDRRDVLADATVVICTIGVGGRRAWEQDVYIPRKYGIFQPVGDSVMPGGTSRALRMIPPMVAIAQDVLDLAPNALFFNYGNPMSPVCRAIRKSTEAEVIGLCCGVFYVGNYLAEAIGVNPADFNYTAIGINHLTWFIKASIHGKDAMPQLHKVASEKIPPGTSPKEWDTSVLKDNPFSWQLLQLFGAFPSCLDGHVTEFFPHFFAKEKGYYNKTLGVDTHSVEENIARGDRIYEEMRETAFSSKPLSNDFFEHSTGDEYTQAVEIIRSIRQNTHCIYSVNVPNRGIVTNLPEEAVIECPAVADISGLKAISQSPLPEGIVGTLVKWFAWVEIIVEAAMEGSREKFVQALVLDGSVNSIEEAGKLADELLNAQKQFLPQFDI